jgi:hypothetical protein
MDDWVRLLEKHEEIALKAAPIIQTFLHDPKLSLKDALRLQSLIHKGSSDLDAVIDLMSQTKVDQQLFQAAGVIQRFWGGLAAETESRVQSLRTDGAPTESDSGTSGSITPRI